MSKVALKITKRRLTDLDDIIDEPNFNFDIKESEWKILSQDELTVEDLAKKKT